MLFTDFIAYLVSQLSYRVVGVCLASVPVTHAYGLYRFSRYGRVKFQECLLFPFSGGNRHVIFQLCSWGLWALSLCAIAPVYTSLVGVTEASSKPLPIIPRTHVDVVSGAAAAGSFIGELFMVKALIVYRSPNAHEPQSAASRYVASAVVIVMGCLLSVTGCCLLLAIEYMPDVASRVLYCCLALSCLLIGASTTYGLGGHLRFGTDDHPSYSKRKQGASGQPAAAGTAAPAEALSAIAERPPVKQAAGAAVLPPRQAQGAAHAHVPGPAKAAASVPAALPTDPEGSTGDVLSGQSRTGSANSLPGADEPLQSDPLAAACMDSTGSLRTGRSTDVHSSARAAKGPHHRRRSSTSGTVASAATAALQGLGRLTRHVRTGSAPPTGQEYEVSDLQNDAGFVAHGLFGQTTDLGAMPSASDQPLDGSEQIDGASGWRFFQPFAGGTAFVATQAVGWSLFAVTIVVITTLAKQLVVGVGYCFHCWALGAGVLMCTTQAILGLSLLTFNMKSRRTAVRLITPLLKHPRATAKDTVKTCRANCKDLGKALGPVFFMYLPVHLVLVAWAVTFTLLPVHLAVTVVLGASVVYYTLTMRGKPQHTGCREWPTLIRWIIENMECSLRFWFGSLELKTSFEGSLDPSQRYVLGFHPHGLYPTGAGFLPLMPSFQKVMGGLRPVTLVASVMFYVPGLRDISMWAGFRQVTKRTFIKALNEQQAVILCPGGQAESLYTYKAFKKERQFVIYTGHKGFVRVALEQRANLVPVLALGEILQMANGWNWPSLQQLTYKRLGFPIPFVMVGRWGYSPLPKKVPLQYILGDPIPPPDDLLPGEPVTEAMVADVHQRFYSTLQALYYKHQASHPCFADAELVMVHK